eukprot:1083909-Pelagomonas_calceolata.AAC.5
MQPAGSMLAVMFGGGFNNRQDEQRDLKAKVTELDICIAHQHKRKESNSTHVVGLQLSSMQAMSIWSAAHIRA